MDEHPTNDYRRTFGDYDTGRREKYGIERVVEALQANIWTSLIRKPVLDGSGNSSVVLDDDDDDDNDGIDNSQDDSFEKKESESDKDNVEDSGDEDEESVRIFREAGTYSTFLTTHPQKPLP